MTDDRTAHSELIDFLQRFATRTGATPGDDIFKHALAIHERVVAEEKERRGIK